MINEITINESPELEKIEKQELFERRKQLREHRNQLFALTIIFIVMSFCVFFAFIWHIKDNAKMDYGHYLIITCLFLTYALPINSLIKATFREKGVDKQNQSLPLLDFFKELSANILEIWKEKK